MGMSDCSECWDTPCSCGHDGYLTVYPSIEMRALFTALPQRTRMQLKEHLRKVLDDLLKEVK